MYRPEKSNHATSTCLSSFRDPNDPGQNFIYHLGDANVWVSNISPHREDHFNDEPGEVEFILNVDSGSPIDVAITITVEDGFVEEVLDP
jgi:hypothetical protein